MWRRTERRQTIRHMGSGTRYAAIDHAPGTMHVPSAHVALRAGYQLISQTTNVQQLRRATSDQLGAQPPHVRVDRARSAHRRIAPHLIRDALAIDELARRAGQKR